MTNFNQMVIPYYSPISAKGGRSRRKRMSRKVRKNKRKLRSRKLRKYH